ncbi:MAG: DUF2058 domain-containing protein [Alcanivoracaceae bacterium]|nr:DUF2058 domain-containing protein [Alcanivoracaceae bacterium]
MAGSLKDQLLKAGLADAKKARQAEHAKRQQAKQVARGEAQDPAQAVRQAREAQAERDRALNAERQAQQRHKEIAAQIRQLVEAHRVDRRGAEQSFQFVDGKKIQKIYVSALIADQLARGMLAVVRLADGFEVVPTAIADKIAERDAAVVVVRHERDSGQQVDDDPYADYPIPDDLMW